MVDSLEEGSLEVEAVGNLEEDILWASLSVQLSLQYRRFSTYDLEVGLHNPLPDMAVDCMPFCEYIKL